MGRHILCSCGPITLGVTHEQQLREMKAGTGLVWLYIQGAGLVGQLWLATGLVQGMWSGHRLLSHLLLSSSVSAGGCDMWRLLVASTGLAGLVLHLWEVQFWYRHFSNTIPASEGAGWQTDFHGRRGVGLNSWMVQLPGSWQGWEEGPARACLAEGKARERGSPESALWCSTLGRR